MVLHVCKYKTTQVESITHRPSDSLEVAWSADVCLCQPLLLPFVLFLPLGERGVHDVVHLRVVMVTVNIADLGVFDVDGGHGQRRTWKMKAELNQQVWFLFTGFTLWRLILIQHHFIWLHTDLITGTAGEWLCNTQPAGASHSCCVWMIWWLWKWRSVKAAQGVYWLWSMV